MFALSRRGRQGVNVWPAFVDVLASLILVFVFMLLMFVLGNVVLTDVLSGRNRALDELNRQVKALGDTLALERGRGAQLQAQMQALNQRLEVTVGEREAAQAALRSMTERAEAAAAQAGELRSQLGEAQAAASAAQAAAASEKGRVEVLNQQIAALREQLGRISAALELSESKVNAQKAEISELGKRLNVALAKKVDELQRYRSEFFGRLREVLGDQPSIRIVGDRFVFQSELLFPTASAELVPEGREQLAKLAKTLKSVTAKIPSGIDWVLRVDGHTDRRPIHTAQFPSNWELSTARALSVVDYLMEQGIPPRRLAAAGFGEYQPIDKANTQEAWARNRRIEVKLTQP